MNLINLNNPHFYITIVLSLLNATMLVFAAYKFLQVLQLGGYRIRGYYYWLKDTRAKYVSRLFMLSFLSICGLVVTNVLFNSFSTGGNYYSYISLIFYFYLSVVFILNMYSVPQKTPLKYTRRMTRTVVSFFVISAILTFFLIAFFWQVSNLFNFAIVAITPVLIPLIVSFVHIITTPIEELIKLSFLIRAKRKLKKHPSLIKIGITGSFGKTSTKYILNTLLEQKYKVCMSPNSFNTPMGLTKVINTYLEDSHQVLIAEMGAKEAGEIRYLCNFIKPQHGILTGIGNQHLETFKNLKTIEKTKYELIASLPQEGFAIFNIDNTPVATLYKDSPFKGKYSTSTFDEEAFAYAKNLKVTKEGSTFDLIINAEKPLRVSTKLMGRHNIQNILTSAALAFKLGLTKEQIKNGISLLKSVPHRLELQVAANNVIILDDSFNASVEGSISALEVLSLFEGHNKIVMTPGLVELGNKATEENIAFGKRIAKVANKCIVVNLVYKDAIIEGLKIAGFSAENIYTADTLEKAQEILANILKAGDVLLIENDLPDNYY